MYKTFNGWKLVGRNVKAGESGVVRNEYGDFLFHKDQTTRKNKTVTTQYDRYGRRITRIVEFI